MVSHLENLIILFNKHQKALSKLLKKQTFITRHIKRERSRGVASRIGRDCLSLSRELWRRRRDSEGPISRSNLIPNPLRIIPQSIYQKRKEGG